MLASFSRSFAFPVSLRSVGPHHITSLRSSDFVKQIELFPAQKRASIIIITTMRSLSVVVIIVVGLGLVVKETFWQTSEKAFLPPTTTVIHTVRHKSSPTAAAQQKQPPPKPSKWQQRPPQSSSSSASRPQEQAVQRTYSKQVNFLPLEDDAHVVTLADMPDLVNTTILNILQDEEVQKMTWEEALVGREPIVNTLHQAGVKFDLDVLKILPYWSDVKELYGEEPVILGLEQCPRFRKSYALSKRFVGITGQHNCGTNAMAKYMMENLIIPQNNGVGNGILANVPWHKHGWVDLRNKYKFSQPEQHDSVLPILIVRDPYFWLKSMCESPYLMKWKHKDICPNLVKDLEQDEGVSAWTMWGKFERRWKSMAHVWSEFNGEYVDADFPRLVIRFEDILFHLPTVMEKIRDCVDARWKHENFAFFPSAVKQTKYFTDIKPQSSMISAIIKYGQDHGRRDGYMNDADFAYAKKHLNAELMEALHYEHPESNRT